MLHSVSVSPFRCFCMVPLVLSWVPASLACPVWGPAMLKVCRRSLNWYCCFKHCLSFLHWSPAWSCICLCCMGRWCRCRGCWRRWRWTGRWRCNSQRTSRRIPRWRCSTRQNRKHSRQSLSHLQDIHSCSSFLWLQFFKKTKRFKRRNLAPLLEHSSLV